MGGRTGREMGRRLGRALQPGVAGRRRISVQKAGVARADLDCWGTAYPASKRGCWDGCCKKPTKIRETGKGLVRVCRHKLPERRV